MGVFLLPIFALVYGHGNMVKPMAWWDANQDGWYYDEEGHDANLGCCTLNLPQDTQFTNDTGKCPDCMKMWFTAKTELPGEVTLPCLNLKYYALVKRQTTIEMRWQRNLGVPQGQPSLMDLVGHLKVPQMIVKKMELENFVTCSQK